MVTIATFSEPAKAKHLKQRFQESGVKADVLTEGQFQRMAAHAKAQANAKVLVEENDFAKAQQLLVEWEQTDPEVGAAMHCPHCNSPRIQYPQMTRKFLTPALAGLLYAMNIFPKEFYCDNCQYTWSDEEVEPRYRFWHRFFSAPPQKQA
ncbi:MAG: hypothetical protein ACJ8LI_08140 [Chthoniobacterales bacterium]